MNFEPSRKNIKKGKGKLTVGLSIGDIFVLCKGDLPVFHIDYEHLK